jgi:tetratricopeptide (TPR) repeat protein
VRQYFKSLLGVSPERIWEVQGASPPPRLDTAPHSLPRDRALLDGYEALFGHMLEVGRPLDAYRIYSRSMGGFGHIGLRAGEMSRGARMMRALAAGDDPARMPTALAASVRGALVYDWGLYAGALGDLAFACRCYATYIEIVEEQGPSAELATGLRTLAYTERLRGELAAARGHIERSAAVAEEAGEVEHRVRAVALLASVLHDMGEVDEAAAHFQALQSMRLSPVARRGLWEAEHNLALGRREAAREATTHNLEVCSRLGWVGHVAHCHTVLGLLSVSVGEGEDEGAARQHLARARTWVGATGEVEVALRCYELAARIELAAGRLEEGARQADDGLRTAEACGFALWRTRLAALMAQCVLEEDPSSAAGVVARALAAAAEDDAWGRADALHWAGVALARAGERARASALLRDASALRTRIKHPDASATAKELEGLSRRAERAARRR